MDWRGRLDRQMGRFFGLSFLLHLCSALLFVAYADRVMSKHHQEVLYIDLSQSPPPSVSRLESKPKSEPLKKPAQTAIPVPAVKKEMPFQPAKASSPPMQQTVIS